MDRRKGAASAFPCHRRGRVWAEPGNGSRDWSLAGSQGSALSSPEELVPARVLPYLVQFQMAFGFRLLWFPIYGRP